MSGAAVTQELLWAVREELKDDAREGHTRLRHTTNDQAARVSDLEERIRQLELLVLKHEAQRQAEKEFYSRQTPPPINRPLSGGWPTFLLMMKATLISGLKYLIGKGNG